MITKTMNNILRNELDIFRELRMCHISKYYQKFKNFTDCSIITFEFFCNLNIVLLLI